MLQASSSFSDSKKHFLILDGLRGVAALVVVMFHVFEIYSGGDHTKQLINHGYLAVDFFFMLSGYVMAHAYDDRWDRMTTKDFIKRRVIRLHPMIIAGMVIGAICFYFQESPMFPNIAATPVWKMLLVFLVGCTLIPLPVSMDIRGWHEMHTLNGPAWSLFYEYIANILHVFILRKLSKLVLGILAFLAAAALVYMVTTNASGDVIGGWSLEPDQIRIGFTRLLFPYIMGMLLRRMVAPVGKRNTFLWCSLLLIAMLSFPRVGGHQNVWANGLYESFTIIVIFPIIIYLGAIGEIRTGFGTKICKFLGDISYPIYIIHYPFIYMMYAWIGKNNIPLQTGIFAGIGLMLFMIVLSYALLKWYDEPVRRWLAKRLMKRQNPLTP